MSKQTFEFTAQRVVFDTSAPVDTVLARLDEELHRGEGGPAVFELLRGAKTREEIEQGIQRITHGSDFMFFGAIQHHGWLNVYNGDAASPAPKIVIYTLGNPLVAQTMLRHDLVTALHVPVRVLVLEKEDRSGTRVVYDLPSSVISPGLAGDANPELKKAAEALDEKLERLVASVTRE
ncbi:hypothetical protein OBBRIDRAFT_432290 [Obba rivulosa]|uniref:DUF302 domain-containing protein n=1 Tax=Obba rivulosa TaxID=1052685 RepID=A0A8E2ALQ0_9APHY|nr:hypothetical protein OBBRIDRAFT_432290 [Obba rivulosa]